MVQKYTETGDSWKAHFFHDYRAFLNWVNLCGFERLVRTRFKKESKLPVEDTRI